MSENQLAYSSESTPAGKGQILVIDDEADIRESLEALLLSEGYQVTLATQADEGLALLASRHFDLVLLDLMMPGKSGLETLAEMQIRGMHTPVFLITAYGSIDVAVQALKNGASDYFSKPWDNEKLLVEIDHQIAKNRLERENLELKRALKQRYSFSNIIGQSESMIKILDVVAQVAQSRSSVLLSGETGTGKELIAKAIHTGSPRADKSFITVNSGSLPPDLLETTLFGSAVASSSRKAALEAAHQGTLFFDEIATLPMDLQVKLLRVMEQREFLPVGAAQPIGLDVRVIAATQEDLKKLVEERRFREDLFYRLSVINLALPPLRERRDDIPRLVEFFFAKYAAENNTPLPLEFEAEAFQLLMEHSWPGNVRELENVVERAVVLSSGKVVPATVLPDNLLHAGGVSVRTDDQGAPPADASLYEIVAAFEKARIKQTLEAVQFRQTDAAELLRIPMSTLNQKIKRLGIVIPRKG